MWKFLQTSALFLCWTTLACASNRSGSPPSQKGGLIDLAAADSTTPTVEGVLAEVPDRELRIEADCRTEAGFRSAVVYGHGVAIWNRQVQLWLSALDVERLIEAVRRHDFISMREQYGGKDDPGPVDKLGLELICRVRLSSGAVDKQVVQLAGGLQHGPLFVLAEEIFAVLEGASAAGASAISLAEGLAKIAAGALAPEVLMVSFLEQPERPSEGGESRRLSIAGGRLEIVDEEGVTARWLAVEEISALAGELAAARPEDWPGNLYSESYIDVSVAVLGFERNVQARGFASINATTHGEPQRRFNHLLRQLRRLRANADR